jgi:DNA-binding transcriptional LysR family regulator
MDLLQLKYFCIVAKMENITNAAEFLNISQPSLSKTIINLEYELGVHLFDRVGRHINLNARGKVFYSKIKDALEILNSAKSEIDESSESPGGEVNLLILAASSLAPELIKTFMSKYPQVHINLHQQIHHDLRYSEEYDFHISATPMDYSQLETVALLTEKVILAVPASHPLAGKPMVNLEETAQSDFITYSRGPSLRVLFDSLCYMAGFTPKIRCECDTLNILLSMISAGFGVSLIPANTLIRSDNIVSIPINNPLAKRTVNLSWRKEKYMSKACMCFKQHCISFFREYIAANGVSEDLGPVI